MMKNSIGHSTKKSEAAVDFIPRDMPLMTFMEAFELVLVKYKDAFDYLEDK